MLYPLANLLAQHDLQGRAVVTDLTYLGGVLRGNVKLLGSDQLNSPLGSLSRERVFEVKLRRGLEEIYSNEVLIMEMMGIDPTQLPDKDGIAFGNYLVHEFVDELDIIGAAYENESLTYFVSGTRVNFSINRTTERWRWIFEGDLLPIEALTVVRSLRKGYKVVEQKGLGISVITPSRMERTTTPRCQCQDRMRFHMCIHQMLSDAYVKHRREFIKAGVAQLI
jgi:hypothetical protein